MLGKRAPALTNSGVLDELCDLVMAKLNEAQGKSLPSKQRVVSSSLTRDALKLK